jgi:hypothetical protein
MKEVRRMRKIIIAHGDVDGVVGAYLLIKALNLTNITTEKLLFTQPHEINKLRIEPNEPLYVIDIAPNNSNIEMTKEFIRTHNVKVWVDHHKGWSALKELIDERFIINEGLPSTCAVLLKAFPSLAVNPETAQLASDGTASDTGRLEQLSPVGWLLYKALKANIADTEIKRRAVRWLINHNPEDEKFLREKAEEYERGPGNIQPWLEKVEIIDGIAVLSEELPKGIDRLALFIEMEKISPKGIGIMMGTTEYGKVISVGTNRDYDLVKVFDLTSGNPRNAILPLSAGWSLERVIDILRKNSNNPHPIPPFLFLEAPKMALLIFCF